MKAAWIVIFLVAGLFIHNATGEVDNTTRLNTVTRLLQTPLHFIANQGQMDEVVVYYAKSQDAAVYCTDQGLTFAFAEGNISLKFSEERHVQPEARGELPGKINYFIGSDPASWRTDVPTFGEIVYRSVYPGIDLVYGGDQRRLKYTFYVQPGADPDQILMTYEGVEHIRVDEATGELAIQTQWGEIRDAAPVAYQEIDGIRTDVDIRFCVENKNSVGFAIGDYDETRMLVLDPMYSTYLGGDSWDTGKDIAVDSSGNAYVTGYTESTSGFPIQNAFQESFGGGNGDAFVTKLSADGSLVYSTYLGGDDDDYGWGIAVDSSGNVYVTGTTESASGFPIQNAFQESYGGGFYGDAFVTKLSAAGSLVYSTYLGGDDWDFGYGIAVDSSGNAYVTGTTYSASGFPIQNAFQGSHGGSSDAFVTKLSTDGSLVYSTYLGGDDWDQGIGIAVDGSGNVYVTGTTESASGFPIQNAFQDSHGGGYDAFVTKLSADGSLAYSTYLGGDDTDLGWGIAVGSSGNVYVTGWTDSTSGFPIQNAFQESYGGGVWDAFVTKLAADGSLVYSTYLGGDSDDSGNGIAADSSGNAYVTGGTRSTSGFPIQNAFQESHGGGVWDAFVTKLSASGSLVYSTYLGGDDSDGGGGIAADNSGNAYVTGSTSSTSGFPIQNAFQESYGGGYYDAFVTKLLIGTADEFAVEMEEGWNLISIPVQLPDNTLATVLQSIAGNYISVWAYDTLTHEWKRFIVGAPDFLNTLETIEAGKGYWINMINADILILTGDAIVDKSIPLESGWNLVGYNCLSELPLADALSSIAGNYVSAWAYDAVSHQWERYIVGAPDFLNTLDSFNPWKGYWIDTTGGCIWTLDACPPGGFIDGFDF